MEKPTKGIVVDAAVSSNPGPGQYRGKDIETGVVLFNGILDNTTNNVAEFIALIHALMWCKKNDKSFDVYSDSVTALAWFRKKQINTTMVPNGKNQKTIDLFQRSTLWMLEQKSQRGTPKKWETTLWGENPADYGFKTNYGNNKQVSNDKNKDIIKIIDSKILIVNDEIKKREDANLHKGLNDFYEGKLEMLNELKKELNEKKV